MKKSRRPKPNGRPQLWQTEWDRLVIVYPNGKVEYSKICHTGWLDTTEEVYWDYLVHLPNLLYNATQARICCYLFGSNQGKSPTFSVFLDYL